MRGKHVFKYLDIVGTLCPSFLRIMHNVASLISSTVIVLPSWTGPSVESELVDLPQTEGDLDLEPRDDGVTFGRTVGWCRAK